MPAGCFFAQGYVNAKTLTREPRLGVIVTKRLGNAVKRNRAKRNKARRELGLKVGDPREVDHRRPLSRGGGNGRSNLRIVSRKTNRSKGAK